MGEILAFVQRVRSGGDWTAAERTRLDALADRFAGQGIDVQVVYGATDEGDPWCVVMDKNDEVLVHVARIGGRFIIHSASDDTLAEGGDLPATLGERMAELEAAATGVVTPFNLASRQGQTLMALIAATAFFYETREVFPLDGHAPDARFAIEDDSAAALPAATADDGGQHEREAVAGGAVLSNPAPEKAQAAALAPEAHAPEAPATTALAQAVPAALPAPATPAPEIAAAPSAPDPDAAPRLIQGSAGDDRLTGSDRAERIEGGDGNDTLQGGGAPQGHLDTLDGGTGQDRIELTSQVVAIGGQGADTFVIATPVALNHADTLLGAITDFSAADGDRLVNVEGATVQLPPRTTPPPGPPQDFGTTEAQTPPPAHQPEQVFVDVNGDGRVDGYLMVGGARAPVEADDGDRADVATDDAAAIVVTGQALDHALFG